MNKTRINIRSAVASDIECWATMRNLLWPDSIDNHRQVIKSYFLGEYPHLAQAFVADNAAGETVGFIELNIRHYAEGSEAERVPYVEGWFVSEPYRNQGFGQALMQQAESWARQAGFNELASDTDIENQLSIELHKRLGFSETDRMVCFLKNLDE